MNKPPSLRELPELPPEICEAALNGQLVIFVGAGVSKLLGLPSWNELAKDVLGWIRSKGWIDFSELEQLQLLDPKKQLSIAKLIAEENQHDFDLAKFFKEKSEENNIYKSINDIGSVCVTTNYDELLAPRFQEKRNDPSMSIKPNDIHRISDKNDFFAKHLDQPGTVIHLHGAISEPNNMVITTKQYLEHYDHKNVQHFLHELFSKKIVLFIGYGLEEVEILEHILRRGTVESTTDRRRFALQGYFKNQNPLYENLYKYYSRSFGVHLIGFVRDHEDYKQQEIILKNWVPQIQIKKPPLADDIARIDEVLGNG